MKKLNKLHSDLIKQGYTQVCSSYADDCDNFTAEYSLITGGIVVKYIIFTFTKSGRKWSIEGFER